MQGPDGDGLCLLAPALAEHVQDLSFMLRCRKSMHVVMRTDDIIGPLVPVSTGIQIWTVHWGLAFLGN